jgi:peptide/nickel transport system permease protein
MRESASPRQQAFARFWRRGAVRIAVSVLLALLLVGIYAPFLANEIAFLWVDGQGVHWPLVADLFNRTSYPRWHDLLFNLISLLLPALGAAWWLVRRRFSIQQRLGGCLTAVLLAWIVAMVPIFPSASGWTACWDYRPLSQYTSIHAHASSAGGDVPHPKFAIFAPIPHRSDAAYLGAGLLPPGAINDSTGAHFWLGTDDIGRDVLATLCFGVRISLTIGFVATGLSLAIGILVGGASGYFGGWIDVLLQRVVEIMMCFPTFIIILAVVAMIGPDIFVIMMVIGLTGWAGTARLVRGEFLAQAVCDYVAAAEAVGMSRWRIILRHMLPNTMAPIIITATFGIAGAVLSESGLSFLGLGDPTTASWGVLLEQGRQNIRYPWLIYAPGIAIFILVTCLNLIGNGLRDAFDPKSN